MGDKLKVCCEAEHYGADCKPCEVMGSNGKLCSGNGKCKGGGTRKGNGKCSCSKEYGGEECDKCSSGFYESFKDASKLLCSPCHKACAGYCSGPGPKACAKCEKGYEMNTEGTHKCMACDKSCDGCDSDGPDNCAACAEGYQLNKDKVCVTDKAAEDEKLKETITAESDPKIVEENAA